ncbi:MAG: Fe-S cluster assembly protein SufD, partial [Gammaproteobacteria bacterium]|nr:Fe-S cluster assembly protein SufD [Gammaproteobacteria bacterium]
MSELSEQLVAALPENFGPGPEWLKVLRQSGADEFRTHGLPTRKDEAWKYTGSGALARGEVMLATESEVSVSGFIHPTPLAEKELQINMLDGQFLAEIGNQRPGLTVLPMAGALNHGLAGLQALLESLTDTQSNAGSTHGFSALNSATLDSGLVIHVAAGTDAGSLSLVWSTRAVGTPLLFNSRVCIILEEGAKLELLEQFESPHDNANTSNIVIQADLGANAEFQHIRFQQETDAATLITRTEVLQQAESAYAYYGFDLGGGLIRHDLHTSLKGRGVKSVLNGAYLLDGNRHVDNHARVDHMAPGGFSDQYFRGVASGSGRAVFNTAVCVHPGADETEARQSNANILLSARAEVYTKPELEIYADEVIASHGATVGQLDEQAVFYMRSRGLSENEARQLLTTAFCRSVSDKLSDPVL